MLTRWFIILQTVINHFEDFTSTVTVGSFQEANEEFIWPTGCRLETNTSNCNIILQIDIIKSKK